LSTRIDSVGLYHKDIKPLYIHYLIKYLRGRYRLLNKNILAIGITILFLSTTVTPMTLGTDVSIKEETKITVLEEIPGIQWTKTFGEEVYSDRTYECRLTKDEGFILAGMTRSFSSDHYEAGWLVKTDSKGTEEWNQTYGEPGALNIDVIDSVQQTFDGGYIFTGLTLSYDSKVWLVKTDSNGYEVFNKVYSGDRGYSVLQSKDNKYIVCGRGINYSVLLLKIDEYGNECWCKEFWGYPGNLAEGNSVYETSDGGFVITGTLYYSDEDIEPDIFLIKTDRNGTEEINVTFGRSDRVECGFSVKQTSDEGYIIAGFINNPDEWIDAWLIKTDANGNMEWNKTFGELNHEYFGQDVIQCDDGGYALTGWYEFYIGDYSSFLIKTDNYGNKIWLVIIPEIGLYDKLIYSIDKTNDGSYILTGEEQKEGTSDALLVKIGNIINQLPSKPIISGPNNGKRRLWYEYIFSISDPDDDLLYLRVDWGDRPRENYGPVASGTNVKLTNRWETEGTFTIRAQVIDIHGVESDWTEYQVTIPRTRASSYHWLFERFPMLERLLDLIYF